MTMAASAGDAAAEAREFLPASHWAYRDVDHLWTRGLVDSLNLSVKPWSRQEVARALASVAEKDTLPADPILLRLLREFADELHDLAPETFEAGPDATLTMREAGGGWLRASVGLSAATTRDEPGKLGVRAESGGYASVRAALGPDLLVATEIRLHRTGTDREIGDSLVKNHDLFVDAGEAYAAFAPGAAAVTAGFVRTRWGPGTTGTLLLSDAAPPFAALRVSRRFAGVVDFRALTGVLAEPDTRYLATHRLSLRLSPSLWVGVAESARYDARHPEFLYVLNLLPYTFVEQISNKDRSQAPDILHRNNVMMSADAVWRVRPGFRLHAEFLVDDLATETATMPHRLAWQAGARWCVPRLPFPADFFAEYTKVFRYTYSTYYGRNYDHSGRPLAYGDGPDVERLLLRWTADPRVDWSVGAEFERRRKGNSAIGDAWDPADGGEPWDGATLTDPIATVTAARVTTAWFPRAHARVAVSAGWARVTNEGHESGRTKDGPEVALAVAYRR
ncbi:MAG: capsule assembly Wzi family protein [Gemmatimonadota bacterium]|jgi:hypothetical protein|nr:capsule assembly Wzi family protein [Gemmatimonadota bacterium]MDP7031046.1 capsule assembly Wzi family protein [Gemmatimonadota bacterium]